MGKWNCICGSKNTATTNNNINTNFMILANFWTAFNSIRSNFVSCAGCRLRSHFPSHKWYATNCTKWYHINVLHSNCEITTFFCFCFYCSFVFCYNTVRISAPRQVQLHAGGSKAATINEHWTILHFFFFFLQTELWMLFLCCNDCIWLHYMNDSMPSAGACVISCT